MSLVLAVFIFFFFHLENTSQKEKVFHSHIKFEQQQTIQSNKKVNRQYDKCASPSHKTTLLTM